VHLYDYHIDERVFYSSTDNCKTELDAVFWLFIGLYSGLKPMVN